jgi:predicted kinase
MNNTNLLIYGLPATGKSAFIAELRHKFEFQYISIDSIWEETFTNPSYTLEESEIVFNKMICQINHTISNKNRVVIEGVFATRERVIMIKELFKKKHLHLEAVLLTASLETLRNRIINRKKKNDIIYERILELNNKFSSSIEADCIINTDCFELSEIKLVLEEKFEL